MAGGSRGQTTTTQNVPHNISELRPLYRAGRDQFARTSGYARDPKTGEFTYDPKSMVGIRPTYQGQTIYDPSQDYAPALAGIRNLRMADPRLGQTEQNVRGAYSQLGRDLEPLYARPETQEAVTQASLPQVQRTLGGEYLNPESNPYLQGAIDRGIASARRSLTEDVLPSLKGFAAQNNRFGSSTLDQLTGRAVDEFGRTAADTAGRIAFQNYDTERGRQHDLAGRLLGQSVGLDADRLARRISTTADLGARGAAHEYNLGQLRAADADRRNQFGMDRIAQQLAGGALQDQLGQRRLDIAKDRWERTSPEYQNYALQQQKQARDEAAIKNYLGILRDGGTTQTTTTPYTFADRVYNTLQGANVGASIPNILRNLWRPRAAQPQAPTFTPTPRPTHGWNPYSAPGFGGIGT